MNNQQLFAGAGAAPIRFSEAMFPTEGFIGVHDEPYARVLILNCGEQVAIACIEMVMLPPDYIAALKKLISEVTNTKAENVWVHVTHVITTPHEPHAPRGPGGVAIEISEEEKKALEGKRTLFSASVFESVKSAAEGAVRTYKAAKMGVGAGECRVNVNRDISTPHGWWINFNPEGPSNHTATVLRFESLDGELIASLISYGLKPCAIDNSEMDVGKRLVSSDVPGLACRLLEEKYGAPCLFAMSAAGDQVPVEQAWYDVVDEDGKVRKIDIGVQEGLKIVDRLGKQMAQEIESILNGVACSQNAPEIKLASGGIEWPGKERNKMTVTKEAEFVAKGMERVDAVAIAIGDLALVGVRPEMCAVTEAQLQEASPYEHTLIMSMVNGGFKYMPDRASYENITWEAQSAGLMPGAAEAWVDEAVSVLNGLKNS